MKWQPIDTAPENTDILVWSPYAYSVSRFCWRENVTQEIESESRNAKGRRKIIQEHITREREWTEDGWCAEWWMPLPEPPESATK